MAELSTFLYDLPKFHKKQGDLIKARLTCSPRLDYGYKSYSWTFTNKSHLGICVSDSKSDEWLVDLFLSNKTVGKNELRFGELFDGVAASKIEKGVSRTGSSNCREIESWELINFDGVFYGLWLLNALRFKSKTAEYWWGFQNLRALVPYLYWYSNQSRGVESEVKAIINGLKCIDMTNSIGSNERKIFKETIKENHHIILNMRDLLLSLYRKERQMGGSVDNLFHEFYQKGLESWLYKLKRETESSTETVGKNLNKTYQFWGCW